MESDSIKIETIIDNYSIFHINKDKNTPFDAEMFLDYEVDNIELMARKLSNGNNIEFKRLLNDVNISEIIYLYAIDSATIHAENKNAELK